MSQPENEQVLPVLTASVHDVRYLAALLRGVNFVNRATVTITENGFTVNVEEARTLLGTAYIFADIFDEYTYTPEAGTASAPSQGSDADAGNTAFEIPINTILECLNIFGTAGAPAPGPSHRRWRRADEADEAPRAPGALDQYFATADKGTGMRMAYAGAGHPLTLLIAEDATGPTTSCAIATYDPEPHLELPFDPALTVLKIILKSSWLRDALSELDPSYDKLTFIGNPPTRGSRDPMLRIHAQGASGSTEMDYPDDRDVLETFECARSVRFSYRVAHIGRTLRALQSSSKTSLRIDAEGLLSLQFLMPSPRPRGGASEAFIEFRCLSLDEDL